MDDGRLMIDLHNESGRRWTTAALVGAALLSAAYWTEATLLRFRQGMPATTLRAISANEAASAAVVPPAEALAKVLGAQQRAQTAALGPADRFKVLGVIASASGRGAALVSVDGQPARAYSVGAELAPGFVLRSVSQKELTLAASPSGGVLATLPLPEPSSANPAGSGGTSGTGTGANPNAAGINAGPPTVPGSRGNPRNIDPPAPPAPPGTATGASPPATPANPAAPVVSSP